MAITQNSYTGNGSTTLYSFTFPYLDDSDVKVTLNGTPTTAYTFANATTIQFNTAPGAGVAIRIYRETDDSSPVSVFSPGSSIKAADLNEGFEQALYIAQETSNNSVDINNPQILGNLDFNNFKGINLATPTANADAANKGYVDSVALAAIPDGNKGDISTTLGSSVWTINDNAVTSSKILDGTIVNSDINAAAGIQASKLSFTQAGTGAVTRTVDGKLKDVVSVKDFGAVGDGVTDDTNAFNAALAAVPSGGAVLATNGTYRINGTITSSPKQILLLNASLTGSGAVNVNETRIFDYGISVGKDFDWRIASGQNSALTVGRHVSMQQDDPGSTATLRIFPGSPVASPTQIAIEPYWINGVDDLNAVGNGEDITSMLCGASSPITVGGGEERGGWVFKNRIAGQSYRHHQITSFATINGTVRPIHVVLGEKSLMKFDYAQGITRLDNCNVQGTTSQGNTVVDVGNSPSTGALRFFYRSNGDRGFNNITSGTTDLEVRFHTNGLSISDTTGYNADATISVKETGTTPSGWFKVENANYNNVAVYIDATRTADSAFSFLAGRSNVPAGADFEFNLRGDGSGFCDGSWNGGGADYAEMFEWLDGNQGQEDRVGYTVSLVNGKIKVCEEGEEPIGVISGNPSVIGDTAWNHWTDKYLTDDFGRYITEEVQTVSWTEIIEAEFETEEVERTHPVVGDGGVPSEITWTETVTRETSPRRAIEHSYVVGEVPSGVLIPEDASIATVSRKVLNPEYNESAEYLPRESRPEWDCVGLMGKLRVRKGQAIGSRWIKMRDISDLVEEWLVR